MICTTDAIDHEVRKGILYVLRYYAIFRYPLTETEIFSQCGQSCTRGALKSVLQQLVAEGVVFTHLGYYASLPQMASLVERREQANRLACRMIPKAMAAGRLIYRFPFVRFVGISGSLSKGYADKRSDFDFFIVTAGNRLWICRTLLHLFKKLTFLAGAQDKFCMNYFLDEQMATLEDQNIYTAIELSSMIPVAGSRTYALLQAGNPWVKDFLPNDYQAFHAAPVIADTCSGLKGWMEGVFNRLQPARLNEWLMQLTDRRWRRKWFRKNYPADQYELAFKTTLYQSKNHPDNYQKKILDQLQRYSS